MYGAYDRICHGDLQKTRNHFEMFLSLSIFIVRALKIKAKERLFLVHKQGCIPTRRRICIDHVIFVSGILLNNLRQTYFSRYLTVYIIERASKHTR